MHVIAVSCVGIICPHVQKKVQAQCAVHRLYSNYCCSIQISVLHNLGAFSLLLLFLWFRLDAGFR